MKKSPEQPRKNNLREQIVATLSDEIAALSPGSRLPGGQELAKRFGVAYMTVTKALDELVVRNAIVRINGKGTFVASRRAQVVYYLIPCPDAKYTLELGELKGALAEADKLGVRLLTVYTSLTNRINDVDWESVRRIPEGAAVIVSGYWYYYLFEFLTARHCRVVYFNNLPDMSVLPKFEILNQWHRIDILSHESIARAVRMLAEAGRKRFLLLHGGVHCQTPSVVAFRRALAAEGLVHVPELELYCHGVYNEVRELMVQFLSEDRYCDAIIAVTTVQALAAVGAMRELHRAVPEEVAIMAMSEDHMLAMAPVSISSLAYDNFEAGAEALRLLAEAPATPTVRKLELKFIKRNSTP